MATSDSATLQIHLLDVGTVKYGDCIVCELGARRILIDGAHPGDYQRTANRPSIPEQFGKIFGHGGPFKFDLLIVTHCHSDHIGCLPTLVEQETIDVDMALVADESLGFGRQQDFEPVAPDAQTTADKLAAALREEDYSHLPDAELAEVLEDIASLESRYRGMLKTLRQRGTRIIRYKGGAERKTVETAFADFGLQVLGPTKKHLEICASAIAGINDQAVNDAVKFEDTDLVSLYRALVGRPDAAGAEDRPGKGAALNDQSIVIKLEVGTATALLAGDMQFAKPEISGLAPEMKQLRAAVKKAAPFGFIKLTHHASYNGFDASLLQEWQPTNRFAHTGGLNDAGHPDPGVLELLQDHRDALQWARTDRNGLITVSFAGSAANLGISFGKLNDATRNADEVESGETAESLSPVVNVSRSTSPGTEISVTAKAGPEVGRITVTIDVTKPGAQVRSDPTPLARPIAARGVAVRPVPTVLAQMRLAAGRPLPKLLFVTRRDRLENNIGVAEATAALKLIRDAGQTVLEVANANSPWAEVRSKLAGGAFKGVVVLGGYDVLPAQRFDVLTPALRSQLANSTDSDNFIVWNDEAYGDADGDMLPEFPVSRIPDAKSSRLVTSALTAGVPSGGRGRFGVRNIARPFANGPYGLLAGSAALLVSQPTGPSTTGVGNDSGDVVYFMLHGSDADATRFWGEDSGGTITAADLSNVPQAMSGVVFAGCCWGALTVSRRASIAVPGQPLGIRTPGQSMALSYLRAGVRAFVGCTGTHYSPTVAPYRYFGGPMHTAFFQRLVAGHPPAQALFEAKIEYAGGMPHGQNSVVGRAIEYKIWKQFTCLGLGW